MLFVNGDDPIDVDVDEDKSQPIYQSKPDKPGKLTEAQKSLESFWPNLLRDIKSIKLVDAKNQVLPLARIKKIMKLDENAKMIAAEAPLLFARACEIFIQELTLRAWIHTEDNKRRTLQRSDIATAISKCDQFDFLIDIVPREDIKPQRKENEVQKPQTEQVQYYLQLAQQHQQAVQNPQPTINTGGVSTSGVVNQTIPVNAGNSGVANVTVAQPQNILLTTNAASAGPTTAAAAAQQQQTVMTNLQNPNQQIQIIQQVVTPTGEITHVPITITANQLNLLRMQMQGNANAAQQQVIIPTIQSQQQPSLVQVNTGGQQNTGQIFLTTAQPTTGNDKNQHTGTFRTNC